MIVRIASGGARLNSRMHDGFISLFGVMVVVVCWNSALGFIL